MKKMLCVSAVLLCMVFALCACVPVNQTADLTAPPTENPTAMPTPSSEAVEAVVEFSTFDVNKKYYLDSGSFVELDLKLPILTGTYDGITAINAFFADKETFFYNELPFESLKDFEAGAPDSKIEGKKDNFYRQAYYRLEAEFGSILSVSAALDGGAGGVSWAGIEGGTFDLNTGKKLGLSDIFEVDEQSYMGFIYDFVSKKVAEEIGADMQRGYGSPYFFEDPYSGDGYESIRSFDPNDFYLAETALVVFYQKYALASGAAGPKVFEIPYETLSDMLKANVVNPQ